MSTTCPLCHHTHIAPYFEDKRRAYLQCTSCQLVFVAPHNLPSAEREKQEYDLHQNTAEDQGYVQFLRRLADPLLSKLDQGMTGLDFGCGPAPVLAELLSHHGHTMQVYDHFYFPSAQILRQQYDFICSTEAIEHFHKPAHEWQIWLDCLKPGGWLAIMTKRVIDKARFKHWHYKNDITHVSFFSEDTFEFLARRDHLSLQFVGADVVLMQKPA